MKNCRIIDNKEVNLYPGIIIEGDDSLVVAPANGYVVSVFRRNGFQRVVIKSGIYTYSYDYLSSILIEKGDSVNKNQLIAVAKENRILFRILKNKRPANEKQFIKCCKIENE